MQGITPYYQPQPGSDPRRVPLAGPLAPAVVMLSNDEKTMYVMAANASWTRSVSCTLNVHNFDVTTASGLLLSHSDVNGHPYVGEERGFCNRLADESEYLNIKLHAPTALCCVPDAEEMRKLVKSLHDRWSDKGRYPIHERS